MSETAAVQPSRWRGIIPAAQWLREYKPAWLRADLVAGATLAAYLLPAAIGDASLAGLPPEAGLYACLSGSLVFWFLCSSRHTAVSVTSAISLLIGSSLGGIAGGDVTRYAALASLTALLVAAAALAAWLARAGSAVNFISGSVMTGFKFGVALVLASTQLPKLFGIAGSHGNFWQCMAKFFHEVPNTNSVALLLGCSALALMMLGNRLLPHKPVALVVVIAGIAAAHFVDLGAYNVKLIGNVPPGLPMPGIPEVHLEDLDELLPLALACLMLGAVETAAVGRMFAEKYGTRLDSNQELLALAGANLAAGLEHGFPVSGGTSQSLVNEDSGARSPLSGLISAGCILLTVIFFNGLLSKLPQPVLAAIVLMAVSHLIKIETLRRLWQAHRSEFFVAVGALAGVLTGGLLKGVLIGAAISMVILLRHAAAPHVAFLGRVPGMPRDFSDSQRHPTNEPTPGVLPFRVESSIVYFNTDHVFSAVLARLDAMKESVRLVICDLSTSPYVDMAGAQMFLTLHAELEKRGIALRLVDPHSEVRDMLRAEGLEGKVGHIARGTSVAQAIDDFQQA